MKFTELSKIMTKDEYESLKGLWHQNHCRWVNGKFTYVCEKCCNLWDSILIAQEPNTEFTALTNEDRMKSIDARDELEEKYKR